MAYEKISFRHACDKLEKRFCTQIAAGLPPATAYGRTYLKERRRGNRVERYDPLDYEALLANPEADVEPVPSKEVSRRAAQLMKTEHVAGFLRELEQADPGSRAREVLAEQAMLGDETAARQAAKQILEDEDKLGQRSSFEHWAELMCAIGAEVVVPIPGGGEAVCDLREMFPKYKDALPPVDVIDKTIRSLQEYRDKQEGK